MLEMTNRATGTEAERKQQAEGVELDARGQRGDLRKLESAWTPTDRPRERRHAGEVGGCEAVPCFCKGGRVYPGLGCTHHSLLTHGQ